MENFAKIRGLYDVWDNSFGIPEEEIAACEKRLGKRLPEILRQYYLQLGNNEQINNYQDRLITLPKIKVRDDEFIVFYEENQGVWQA